MFESRLTIKLRISFALLSLLAAGCYNSATEEQSAPQPEIRPVASEGFRGFVVFGHEVRSFRPCGSEDVLWVTDRSGLLWNLHQELAPNQQPYEELFVVLLGRIGPAPTEGFGADYPAELVVEQILYAAQEGFSCDSKLDRFHYHALGNEPFWSAEISQSGIVLKRLGESDTTWKAVWKEPIERGVRYSCQETTEFPIEIEIIQAECRDSMSGAFFGYKATLRVGSEKLSGCALKSYAK